MHVRIHFHGAIDRRGLAQDHLMELEAPMSIGALLSTIGYLPHQLRFIIPMVGGERCHPDQILGDGDQLDILTPYGGG